MEIIFTNNWQILKFKSNIFRAKNDNKEKKNREGRKKCKLITGLKPKNIYYMIKWQNERQLFPTRSNLETIKLSPLIMAFVWGQTKESYIMRQWPFSSFEWLGSSKGEFKSVTDSRKFIYLVTLFIFLDGIFTNQIHTWQKKKKNIKRIIKKIV